MAGVSCLALALLLIWISPYAWATFHRKGAWHSSKASRPFISLFVLSNLAAVVLFGFFVRQLLRADPDYKVAGGFVYDHRIFLQKEHLQRLRNDDKLICALDHELTHYFGVEGLGIIRGDSWLSYAYPAVFALERGGFPMLQRETALLGTFSPIAMYAFSRGVISAEGTIPPGDAEADFIKTTLTAPINPNARSDASSEQGADANRGFDFGLAGIAWYVAAGNANIALSYLDDRSNGISAAEATGRASRKLESGDRSAARENQREFFITVVRYLLKESEHFRKALKNGKGAKDSP